MKKLIGFILVLFACMFSFGCKDQEQIDVENAINNISITDFYGIKSNMKLEDRYQYVFKASWEVTGSKNAIIKETRDGTKMLNIIRSAGEGGEDFTIKLTLTSLSGKTATKTFEGYIPNIVDDVFEGKCADIYSEDIKKNDYIKTTGVVTYIAGTVGFWMVDDSLVPIYVYTNTDPNGVDIFLGDEVTVLGVKDIYYSVTQIAQPSVVVTKNGTNTYNYESDHTLIENMDSFKDINLFGTDIGGYFYKFGGVVITDPSGKYTYAIQCPYSGYTATLYDSFMTKEQLEFFASNKGKYVTSIYVLHDSYSSTFFRFVPIKGTTKQENAPVIDDKTKIEIAKKLIEAINTKVSRDLELPTTLSLFNEVVITWTSDKPTVLGADGNMGTSTNTKEDVVLTAKIKVGELEEEISLNVTVTFAEKTTIAYANQIISNSPKGTLVWVEGKVISLHANNYFYLADDTGVTFIYTALPEGIEVGDCVKVVGKTELYIASSKNQYTREITNAVIQKIDTEIEILESVEISLENIKTVMHEGTSLTDAELKALSESDLLGKLYSITGYVVKVVSGTYTNYYIAVTDSTDSIKLLYHYQSANLDVIGTYVGKKITIVAPMNDYAIAYGFRIGSYTSITVLE